MAVETGEAWANNKDQQENNWQFYLGEGTGFIKDPKSDVEGKLLPFRNERYLPSLYRFLGLL